MRHIGIEQRTDNEQDLIQSLRIFKFRLLSHYLLCAECILPKLRNVIIPNMTYTLTYPIPGSTADSRPYSRFYSSFNNLFQVLLLVPCSSRGSILYSRFYSQFRALLRVSYPTTDSTPCSLFLFRFYIIFRVLLQKVS